MTVINANELSSILSSIIGNTDFSNVQSSTSAAIDKYVATQKTILGQRVGQVLGGIESLTKDVDQLEDFGVAQFVPNVARLTDNIPNLSSKLIGNTGGAAGDIQSITGDNDAAVGGFLYDIITRSSASSIETTLKDVVGATEGEIRNAIQAITQIDLRDIVMQALQNTPYADYLAKAEIFVSQVEEKLGSNSGLFLVDLVENVRENYKTQLNTIFDRQPAQADVDSTFNLVTQGKYDEAFTQLQRYVDLPENFDETISTKAPSTWSEEITEAIESISVKRSIFDAIDVSLTGNVDQYDDGGTAVGFNTLPVFEISSSISSTDTSIYTGTSTAGESWSFDHIGSADELEALFRNISRVESRAVAGAIVHWTATFTNQNIDANWVDDIHKGMGWTGCGYHILILRDGTLQRGRPMNLAGAHDDNNNTTFLGFCFVGGYSVSSKVARKPYWKHASSDSFTPQQWKAYDILMGTFHKVFPFAQVAGHYMTDSQKMDPGFDVVGYSEAKFNHRNVIGENDPIWRVSSPITRDIIRQYAGGAT